MQGFHRAGVVPLLRRGISEQLRDQLLPIECVLVRGVLHPVFLIHIEDLRAQDLLKAYDFIERELDDRSVVHGLVLLVFQHFRIDPPTLALIHREYFLLRSVL